jgi:hypothetical protein
MFDRSFFFSLAKLSIKTRDAGAHELFDLTLITQLHRHHGNQSTTNNSPKPTPKTYISPPNSPWKTNAVTS